MHSIRKSLLALVGLLAIVAASAALMPLVGRGQVGDNHPLRRDPRRSYYLTQIEHNGNQALTACAPGYHMASLWEIHDTSNLRYDTALGITLSDSGFGPPSGIGGWIRTGSAASNATDVGRANCINWTSASGWGTVASPDPTWDEAPVVISPWSAGVVPCGSTFRVWCVQD